MNTNTNSSRRAFMKTAGLVSAGVTLGAFSTVPSVHAAGSDIIKVGLIGCGGRGMGSLLDCFRANESAKVVALGDVDRGRVLKGMEDLSKMEDRKEQVDLSPDRLFGGFDNYKGVTELADLVLINSPPGFHPDHYAYAVERGKHVFMEKPFGVDAEGYRRCMKANKLAEEKGLTVCAGFQRRHEKKYLEWIARLHAGFIGDIVSSRVYWNSGGARVRGIRGATEPEMIYQVRNWYFFNWLSGDHNVEQHCHNIDVGNWIHGKGDPLAHPVSCVGHGGRQVRRTPKFPCNECGNIFDHHYVEYRYADGSIMHSMCRQIPNNWNLIAERIAGTKGYGEMGGRGAENGWLQPTVAERWAYPRNQDPNGYLQEHINQTEAMRKGERLHDGWFAATSTMTAVMGWMATYSGQEILWDDAVAKGRTIFPYDVELTNDTVSPVMPGPDGTYEHAVAVPGEYDPFDKV